MVATKTARTKAVRKMRDLTVDRPIDDLTLVRFEVLEGARQDRYLAIHWVDSCDVRVCHSDDPERSYVVTCSAVSGEPTRCTCDGHQYRGTRCRHMASVAKLAELGVLTLPVLEDAGHDQATTD